METVVCTTRCLSPPRPKPIALWRRRPPTHYSCSATPLFVLKPTACDPGHPPSSHISPVPVQALHLSVGGSKIDKRVHTRVDVSHLIDEVSAHTSVHRVVRIQRLLSNNIIVSPFLGLVKLEHRLLSRVIRLTQSRKNEILKGREPTPYLILLKALGKDPAPESPTPRGPIATSHFSFTLRSYRVAKTECGLQSLAIV